MNKVDLSEDYIVQKSRPLYSLWSSGFTLSEFKILDTYLSKINSKDESTRNVIFTKSELQKLLGVKSIRTEVLNERFRNLQRAVISAIDDDEKNVSISLFDKATIYKDSEEGVVKAELRCTPAAVEYFFNIDRIGYIRYKIRAITQISSLYTYLLFMYIEYNRFRKSWSVSVSELKTILGCDKQESLKEFRFFNRDVLKKSQKEIIEKADCHFDYTTIRDGKTVVGIKFTITSDLKLPDVETDDYIPEVESNDDVFDENVPDIVYKYAVACKMKFDTNQLICINGIISSCDIPENIKGNTDEEKQFNYFQKIYSKFLMAESQAKANKKLIKNPVQYFIKIIENDLIESSNEKNLNKIKDQSREEQSYDLDEFEKFAVTFSGNTKGKIEFEEEALSPSSNTESIPNLQAEDVVATTKYKSISREELDAFLKSLET